MYTSPLVSKLKGAMEVKADVRTAHGSTSSTDPIHVYFIGIQYTYSVSYQLTGKKAT